MGVSCGTYYRFCKEYEATLNDTKKSSEESIPIVNNIDEHTITPIPVKFDVINGNNTKAAIVDIDKNQSNIRLITGEKCTLTKGDEIIIIEDGALIEGLYYKHVKDRTHDYIHVRDPKTNATRSININRIADIENLTSVLA